MTNLTPSEARRLIDKLHHNQTKEHGISILEGKYLAALEIALTALEQQGGLTDLREPSPYDVPHTMPSGLIGAISEKIAITFSEEDAQEIWDCCRHEAMKATKPDITPKIENDGWVEWKGDTECPVPDGTKVDIKFRDGDIFFGENTSWDWSWDEDEQGGADIIAYRKADNNGWIEWCGNRAPVDLGATVQVRWKDGDVEKGPCSHFHWGRNCMNPIIAYRVIENDGREG